MTALQSLFFMVLHLSLYAVPLLAAVCCLVALWLRRRKAGNFTTDTPLGSPTSRVVETITIAAACGLLVACATTQLGLHSMLFDNTADPGTLRLWGVALTACAVTGLALALFFAWRGAGSVAVVALILLVFGCTAAIGWADHRRHRESWRNGGYRQVFPDVQLTLDIGGCNVEGAEMRVNGVSLGKTPVRIKLSEFLGKVPDWDRPPGTEEQPEGSSTFGGPTSTNTRQQSAQIPRDPTWGFVDLPDLKYIALAAELEQALRKRKGRNLFVQVVYNGEYGERTGSAGGGGVNNNYSINIDFRFPKREAAIERLLNQARLAEYNVDQRWLQSANKFGRDAWQALVKATLHEPDIQKVLDAWANSQHHLDPLNIDDPWRAFERIQASVDEQGEYLTSSPAGRAVELLSPRLTPWQLATAAEPLIESIDSYQINQSVSPDGRQVIGVVAEGARPTQNPDRGGSGTFMSGSGGRQLKPSGLVLAHAIWLVNRRLGETQEFDDTPNEFQQRLAPALLRKDVERHTPFTLRFATLLGGPVVEKFLTRQANRTQGLRWEDSPPDFEMGQTSVNRWLYWAAQLPGPVGRRFREQHLEEVFAMADELAIQLFGSRDDVAGKLPFLFAENDLGVDGIGRQYWLRFRAVVERQPYSALDNQLGYLVALGPAAEPQMFVDILAEAWDRGHDQSDIVEFLQWRLPELPVEKQAETLDGLLKAIVNNSQRNPAKNGLDDYVLRELREARYLELDDPAAVEYLLKWFRDELPEGERPGPNREAFVRNLPQHAAQHANLIEALAQAPKTDLRLTAVSAIRELPTPRSQELLRGLLKDQDEQVRTAAAATEEYWKSLKKSTD